MAATPTSTSTADDDHDHTTDTPTRGTARTADLRQLDDHASWEEVYYACHTDGVGHE